MELASFSYFRIFELKKIIIKITFMPQYYICFNLYFSDIICFIPDLIYIYMNYIIIFKNLFKFKIYGI